MSGMNEDELLSYNREAWNHAGATQAPGPVPVSPDQVSRARAGRVRLGRTPPAPGPILN